MGTKISQMPELTAATNDAVIPVVSGTSNHKITIENLKAYGASLFINDITKTNAGDTAGVTPNKTNIIGSVFVVDAVSTQNNNVRVSVEWDGSYDQYKGDVTVNGVAILVANTVQLAANIRRFRGFADVVLSNTGLYANVIRVIHSAGNQIEIPVTFAAAAQIVDVAPTMASGVTELPPARSFNVKVTSTQSFTQVKLRFNGTDETSYTISSAVDGANFSATISAQLPSSFNNSRGTLTITASAINGSGASAFANPLNKTIIYNGFRPVVGSPTYTYPASQTAIKGSESVTITWSLAGTDASLVSGLSSAAMSVTSGSLAVGTVSYNAGANTVTAQVTRGASALVFSTNNIQLIAKSTVNDYAAAAVNGQINVAETPAAFTSNTSVITKGGATTPVVSNFNQPVFIQSVSISANRGTLDATALPVPQVSSLTKNITVSASDIFSASTNNLVITVRTLSNVVYVLNRLYQISGFAPVTLTFTAPQTTAAIPFPIVTNADIVITNAVINSAPPLPLTLNLVSSPALFTGAEDCALINSPGATPSLVINEAELRGFYYTNGTTITLNIEEV